MACAVATMKGSAPGCRGYARLSGKLGGIHVTPALVGINAQIGVFGAWTDSIPLLVISGQVKRETCMTTYPDLHLRQSAIRGRHPGMARGITNYQPLWTIRQHPLSLERASISGSPVGRSLRLDIPIDVRRRRRFHVGVL